MNWLRHPAYARLRDRLIKRFQNRVYRFRRSRIRQLVFLCGAADSTRRDYLAKYLRKRHPNKLIFYADDVWTHISDQQDLNALQMENQLAQLSDAVVILIESPGTFAELGAFSLSSELRRKLLPIIDKQFELKSSFINSGPVQWVNQDSDFRPTIYADFSAILTAAREIDERLERIRPYPFENISDIANRPRHLLFLLSDLLSIIAPAPERHIHFYLKQIIGRSPLWSTINLLGLGVALQLVSYLTINGAIYYYRTLTSEPFSPFLHKRMFNIAEERATLLSTLITIPTARHIIEQMKDDKI